MTRPDPNRDPQIPLPYLHLALRLPLYSPNATLQPLHAFASHCQRHHAAKQNPLKTGIRTAA